MINFIREEREQLTMQFVEDQNQDDSKKKLVQLC